MITKDCQTSANNLFKTVKNVAVIRDCQFEVVLEEELQRLNIIMEL
jgi:hypothetical protein